MEANICHECKHSFITCVCKSCLKCGTLFMKYFRTNFIKGRSHCRICTSPVCCACIISIKGYQKSLNNSLSLKTMERKLSLLFDELKVCTRCEVRRKEEELNTEKAIVAVSEAKFGLGPGKTSNVSNLRSDEDRRVAFFEASKNGLDHILMALISAGCDVNCKDASFNTPLHYAAQGGFIAALALLIEKGADMRSTNNIGWTALHFVASKGTTDHHIECTKFLLEMGLDVLSESNTGETPADVADRCNVKLELIQLLKAAEVEIAMEELGEKSKCLFETSVDPEEKRFGRIIITLINFVSILSESENNSKTSSNFSSFVSDISDNKEESITDPEDGDAVIVERFIHRTLKPINIEKEQFSRNSKTLIDRAVSPIEDELQGIMHDNKVNLDLEKLLLEKKHWEERCQTLLTSIADSNKNTENTIEEKKEWQVRYQKLIDESAEFKQEFQKSLCEKREWEEKCERLMSTITASNDIHEKIRKERDEWEERCRKMMTVVADSTKEHKRQIDKLVEDNIVYRQDKDEEMEKHEAAYINKLNKLKQDYKAEIAELQNSLLESQLSLEELLQFQKGMKLTWVPDEFVTECQEANCKFMFSAVSRKHHCRCCGRVFCDKCSQRKIELSHFGYTKPVRVCDSCHVLADKTVT